MGTLIPNTSPVDLDGCFNVSRQHRHIVLLAQRKSNLENQTPSLVQYVEGYFLFKYGLLVNCLQTVKGLEKRSLGTRGNVASSLFRPMLTVTASDYPS